MTTIHVLHSLIARIWSGAGAAFVALARRRALAIALVFAGAFVSSLGMVVGRGEWKPAVHDEYAYLLGAETFMRGRLANPPHAMARHLETFHVLQRPTYVSKYPPANSLFIAAGWKLGGRPSAGIALSFAFMCASICWMLQAWLGRPLGLGLSIAFTLGLADGYWATSYWGGAVAAGGGALVLGAMHRLLHADARSRPRAVTAWSITLAAGLLVLANSRPYEGLCLSLPVLLVLALHRFRRQREGDLRLAVRRELAPFAIVMALGGATMLTYNHATTGKWYEMPYTAYEKANSPVPFFVWQRPREAAPPTDAVMRRYIEGNAVQYERARTLRSRVKFLRSVLDFVPFLIPAVVLLPFLLLPSTTRHRETRLALLVIATTVGGMVLSVYYFEHYGAPMTAAILAVYGVCLRQLGRMRLGRRRIGRSLVAGVLLVWSAVALRQSVGYLRWARDTGWRGWADRRQAIADSLARDGRADLVIVRYGANHPVESEWVYNGADIDAQPVVWARDLGAEANAELTRYFRDRNVVTVDVDRDGGPFPVQPYRPAPPPLVEPSAPTSKR